MFRERVRAPWYLWLLAVIAAISVGLAIGAAFARNSDIISGLITFALIGFGLIRTTVTIEVTDDSLVVDDASLPRRFVGEVRALTADQARAIRGPQADPAAYLVLRGWVPTAVMVTNTDTDDPVPYWFISTRHPNELAQALRIR